jgi:hypothetical protein
LALSARLRRGYRSIRFRRGLATSRPLPLESTHHGEWRSLVAHPAGGRAVAGSNPVSPIATLALHGSAPGCADVPRSRASTGDPGLRRRRNAVAARNPVEADFGRLCHESVPRKPRGTTWPGWPRAARSLSAQGANRDRLAVPPSSRGEFPVSLPRGDTRGPELRTLLPQVELSRRRDNLSWSRSASES